MTPAIILYGNAGTSTNAVYTALEKIWLKHEKYLLYLWGGSTSNAPLAYAIYSSPTVLWAEVEDASKGEIKVIYRETANFKPEYLAATTEKFLARFDLNHSGEGNPVGSGDSKPDSSGKEGDRGTGTIMDKGGDFGFFPFGNVFDLNLNIPTWLWLVGAGLAGMKFLDTSNKVGKIAYGALGAWCTINYLNKADIPLPFKIPGILGAIPPQRTLPKRIKL